MLDARYFKWLPNILTISRFLLAVGIFVVVLHEAWAVAFWIFIGALATDFLDGLAAKRLHAKTALGAKLDGSADALLVVAGLVGLGFAGRLSWWFVGVMLVIASVLASDQLSFGHFGKPSTLRTVMAVSFLFISWIGLVLILASLAFGWSWFYVPTTVLVLIVLALLKRHRIRTWLGRHTP